MILPVIDGELAEKVKKIVEYLQKLSDKLFKEPLIDVTYLVAWYSEYITTMIKLIKEVEKQIKEAQKAITEAMKVLTNLKALNIPNMVENIAAISTASEKTQNNSESLSDEINKMIFDERAKVEEIETTIYEKEKETDLIEILEKRELEKKEAEEKAKTEKAKTEEKETK